MAEIEMERRPRRNIWIWVAAAVLILVLAVGAWLLYDRGMLGTETGPATDTPATTAPGPQPTNPHGDGVYVEPTDTPDRAPDRAAPEGARQP